MTRVLSRIEVYWLASFAFLYMGWASSLFPLLRRFLSFSFSPLDCNFIHAGMAFGFP